MYSGDGLYFSITTPKVTESNASLTYTLLKKCKGKQTLSLLESEEELRDLLFF